MHNTAQHLIVNTGSTFPDIRGTVGRAPCFWFLPKQMALLENGAKSRLMLTSFFQYRRICKVLLPLGSVCYLLLITRQPAHRRATMIVTKLRFHHGAACAILKHGRALAVIRNTQSPRSTTRTTVLQKVDTLCRCALLPHANFVCEHTKKSM